MDSRRRSLTKALSWRAVALVITTVLGYLFTGSVAFAASIGVADSLIKILAYYLHERAWNKLPPELQAGADAVGEDPSQSGRRLVAAQSTSSR